MTGGMPLITLTDTQCAAVIIFCISITGTVANCIVAIFTRKLSSMNNPFGRLTASQATGESVLCGVFAFYISPMMFFDIEWMKKNSDEAGWINLMCYDICIWSHLFIALNRLVAICFPLKYNDVFSPRNTKLFIIYSWTMGIVTSTILQKGFPCDLFYTDDIWAFVFERNEICDFIAGNVHFYKDISFVIVIATMDIITIINVRMAAVSMDTSTQAQKQRRKRDINFLKQAVLQGMVFAVELHTYFIFSSKFQNKWAVFAMTSVAWNCVHTLDGIIIISFNKEFHRLFWTKMKIHQENVVSDAVNSITIPQGLQAFTPARAFTDPSVQDSKTTNNFGKSNSCV